jgi:hypothetical protein
MEGDMANVERRRHERVKVDRAVTIRDGSEMHDGVLMDISSSGAAVSLDDDDYEFESDQDLELEMEEFGILSGNELTANFGDGELGGVSWMLFRHP